MIANEGSLQALVIDDENQVREFGSNVLRDEGWSASTSHQPADGGASEVTAAVAPVDEEWVTLSEIEGRYVARVLEHTGGNKQAAARILAVDRKTLDRMIKRHHINTHQFRGQRVKVSDGGK